MSDPSTDDLERQLRRMLSGLGLTVKDCWHRRWASITFAGERWRFAVEGEIPDDLSESGHNLAGHIIADIAANTGNVIEILTVENS